MFSVPWTPQNIHALLHVIVWYFCSLHIFTPHGKFSISSSTYAIHNDIVRQLLHTTINVLSNDGPVRSVACASLMFKNIILNLVTIVCICWIKLKKLNYNARMENIKVSLRKECLELVIGNASRNAMYFNCSLNIRSSQCCYLPEYRKLQRKVRNICSRVDGSTVQGTPVLLRSHAWSQQRFNLTPNCKIISNWKCNLSI